MLTTIETTERLTWNCLLYHRNGRLLSCGQEKVAHIDETVYLVPEQSNPRGPAIALPRCACGTQTFLKGDYNLEEIWECCTPIPDASGNGIWTYGMWPRHARNLVAHQMHYERGNAPFAPVLSMPPEALLQGWLAAGHDADLLYALWFGWRAYEEYGHYQRGVLPVASPPLLLPEPHEKG